MGFIDKNINDLELPKGVISLQQTYTKEEGIKDVLVFKTNNFADDLGGWFKETIRLNDEGQIISLKELGVSLRVRQSNTSYITGGGRRFWHIHPTQNELWTTNSTLLVGLIDIRKDSSTHFKKQKIILSSDKALYIPSGVAHGFINPNSSMVTLTYFTDQQFVSDENTQEFRIDPKNMSFDFVEPEIM